MWDVIKCPLACDVINKNNTLRVVRRKENIFSMWFEQWPHRLSRLWMWHDHFDSSHAALQWHHNSILYCQMTGFWHTMADHTPIVTWSDDHTLYCHMMWWLHPYSHIMMTTPSIVTWSDDYTLYCHIIWWPHPLLSHDVVTTTSTVIWLVSDIPWLPDSMQ